MMGMSMELFREQNKPGVLQSIKSDLVLEAVVKAEGLEASEEEVSAEVDRLAQQYGMEADKIKEVIPAENLANAVKLDKASKLIYDSAVVEEAPAAEETHAEEAPAAEETPAVEEAPVEEAAE